MSNVANDEQYNVVLIYFLIDLKEPRAKKNIFINIILKEGTVGVESARETIPKKEWWWSHYVNDLELKLNLVCISISSLFLLVVYFSCFQLL